MVSSPSSPLIVALTPVTPSTLYESGCLHPHPSMVSWPHTLTLEHRL